jgi:nitroreductase
MDILEAMQRRHSVRQYLETPLSDEIRDRLQQEAEACSREGGLHLQLITDEPDAFSGALAHYGRFSGVRNYIVLAGKEAPDLLERAGYYGERLVITAQQLGLNTCWVALSFSRRKTRYTLDRGEKFLLVISLGYGAAQGTPHRSKPVSRLIRCEDPVPDWFRRGAEYALLAPTAMNQQRFLLELVSDRTVRASALPGPWSRLDLGIV